MKRIIILAIVAISVFVASLATLPFLISNEGVKARLNARIAELTGSRFTYKGQPKLSLHPFLQVEIFDVVLRGNKETNQETDLLHAEHLKFNLKMLPLVFGKIRLSNFQLIRPKFNLIVREDGSVNWFRTLPKNLTQFSDEEKNSKFGQFEIVDGIIETTLAGHSERFRVSNLNANIDWPSLSSAWQISGKGVWRGETINFFNRAQTPKALFSSGMSPMQITLESPALKVSFDGEANTVSGIQLRGEADIQTPSLPRLIDLIAGGRALAVPPISKFSINGKIAANTKEVRFDQASMVLDSNVAVGNLQFYWSGDDRAKASGTLAFSTLDITPLLETVATVKPSTSPENSKAVVRNSLDMDIRFSAQNYKIGDSTFGTMAATSIVSGAEWTFDIGEAEFFGGMIIATFSSKSVKDEHQIELKGNLVDIAMGDVAQDWYGGEIFASGKANIKFNLKAMGKNALANLRKFSGNMAMTLPDGKIEGLDLTKAIPALDKNNGFVTIDELKGSTPFQNLTLDLFVYNGVGWITKAEAQGEIAEFRLTGKADLLRGGLAINADIRQPNADNSRSQNTRIFIGGTINNPLVTRTPLSRMRPDERSQSDG